jgi:hypothetical protein
MHCCLLIGAILLSSTAPLRAQHQQQNVAKLKESARNTVGIIGSDKAKTQTYCKIIALERKFIGALSEKDRKKADALGRQIDEFRKELPETVVLSKILKRADLKSPDGQEILSIVRSLDQECVESP